MINHKNFKSRKDFDNALDTALSKSNVEFVCLAGFMRILTADFVKKWSGRMLNTHPSLLPSFKGMHAHRDVLKAGVKVSGCTVHFVAVSNLIIVATKDHCRIFCNIVYGVTRVCIHTGQAEKYG